MNNKNYEKMKIECHTNDEDLYWHLWLDNNHIAIDDKYSIMKRIYGLLKMINSDKTVVIKVKVK
jgi:hypothetical protein|tara:strand:+ start:86 stop:277 length:192 start_codon:yes stop_codon:yes gene_type:complete